MCRVRDQKEPKLKEHHSKLLSKANGSGEDSDSPDEERKMMKTRLG